MVTDFADRETAINWVPNSFSNRNIGVSASQEKGRNSSINQKATVGKSHLAVDFTRTSQKVNGESIRYVVICFNEVLICCLP